MVTAADNDDDTVAAVAADVDDDDDDDDDDDSSLTIPRCQQDSLLFRLLVRCHLCRRHHRFALKN